MKKIFIGFILSVIVLRNMPRKQNMITRKHFIRSSILIPEMIIAVQAVNPVQSIGRTVPIIRSMQHLDTALIK